MERDLGDNITKTKNKYKYAIKAKELENGNDRRI